MKRWVLNLLAMLIGATAGLFLLDNQMLYSLFNRVSSLFLSITPYIIYGMLFFMISAGAASLNLQGLTRQAVRGALSWVLIIAAAAVLTGGFISSLLPALPLREFAEANSRAISSRFEEVLSFTAVLLTADHIQRFYLSYGLLLSVIIISFILGYGITPRRDVLRPAYSVINSFSEVVHTLLPGFAHVLNIGLGFLSGLFLARLLMIREAHLLLPLFIYITITVAIFMLLVIPLAAALLTKERRPFYLLSGAVSPMILAFISGSSSYALPVTLQHARRNLGTAKRVNSTTLPIISLLGRSGSTLMSILILTAFHVTVISEAPSLITIGKIAGVSTLISLAAYMVPGFEVLMITAGTAAVLGLSSFSDMQLTVMFILYPLIQGAAAMIDTLSAAVGSASCGYLLHAHVGVSRKERI